MDETLIKLAIVGSGFVVAGFLNYAALSMADAEQGKLRPVGVIFGSAGILLLVMVVLWPLISLIYYFVGDATSIAKLFNPLLISAGICTLASIATIAADACGIGRKA